jgi:hypothetical protein
VNYHEQIAMASRWLESTDWQATDRHLARARASGIRYRHLGAELDSTPGTVSIIRGPGRSARPWHRGQVPDRRERLGRVEHCPGHRQRGSGDPRHVRFFRGPANSALGVPAPAIVRSPAVHGRRHSCPGGGCRYSFAASGRAPTRNGSGSSWSSAAAAALGACAFAGSASGLPFAVTTSRRTKSIFG